MKAITITLLERIANLEKIVYGTVPGAGQLVVPAGVVDGVNTTFTIPSPGTPGKVMVFYNGALQADFTVAGVTLELGWAPNPGDNLQVWIGG